MLSPTTSSMTTVAVLSVHRVRHIPLVSVPVIPSSSTLWIVSMWTCMSLVIVHSVCPVVVAMVSVPVLVDNLVPIHVL